MRASPLIAFPAVAQPLSDIVDIPFIFTPVVPSVKLD